MNIVKKRPALELGDDDEYKNLDSHSVKKPKGDLANVSPLDSGSIGVTSNLENLVNVADLNGAPHYVVEQRFDSIAEAILCNHHLVVGSTSPSDGTKSESAYEVLEIEFYLWMEGSHRDPFTHGSEEQRISGQWYFHRAPQFSMDSHRNMTSQTMYRAGSRKGLDLTIGRPFLPGNSLIEADNTASVSRFFPNGDLPESTTTENDPSNVTSLNDIPNPMSTSDTDIRGGILLRSLRRLSDGKVICGPSLLVDEILQTSNSDSIPDLVTSKWNSDINAFRSESSTFLCFRPHSGGQASNLPQVMPQNVAQDQKKARSPGTLLPTVYSSPRIGLDLSHPGTTPSRDHPRLNFLSKRYRFFTHPELLEKGRPQSFIGILHYCLRNGHTLRATTASKNGGTIDSFFGKSGNSSRSSGSSRGPNGKLRSEVMKIMNVKEATVEKYFTEYFAGLDKGVMKLYIGAAGKGASTSPATYLRMIGTLERLLDSAVSS